MTSVSTLAAIRFGYGLSGRTAAPDGPAALLAEISGKDKTAIAFPIPSTAQSVPLSQEYLDVRRQRRAADKAADGKDKAAGRALQEVRTRLMRQRSQVALSALGRAATGPGFRERLVRFWADHFTVRAKNLYELGAVDAFADEAIRPHLGGTFGEMLVAAAMHPAMLVYLDQVTSFGPESTFAKRHNKGLNENLAREILELHSLGVDGAYDQADVRTFAKLLTGLQFSLDKGFQFLPNQAEPGAETLFGKSYGGAKAKLEDISQALHDIALHPDTARHLARKLAVHFVADAPDPALVDHMAAAYATSGGDLSALYAAMLEHPAAWEPVLVKAKQPFDFIASALRALDVDMAGLLGLKFKEAGRAVLGPMGLMGQPFQEPFGPNGWPEEELAWINPQGLAARIQWAMQGPQDLLASLPDPRGFVETALGDVAGDLLKRAVSGAESTVEGVGLVLASVEFNRR